MTPRDQAIQSAGRQLRNYIDKHGPSTRRKLRYTLSRNVREHLTKSEAIDLAIGFGCLTERQDGKLGLGPVDPAEIDHGLERAIGQLYRMRDAYRWMAKHPDELKAQLGDVLRSLGEPVTD